MPVCVVSSDLPGPSRSAVPENVESVVKETGRTGPESPSKPKRSGKNVVSVLLDIQKDKKKRHEDMMQRMEAMNESSNEAFKEMMQKLIDKM